MALGAMLILPEWLERAGFSENPFAFKQADKEDEQLNEYFMGGRHTKSRHHWRVDHQ